MKLAFSFLAVALATASGGAVAQNHPYGDAPYGDYGHRVQQDDRYPLPADRSGGQGAHYDWARVLRVDPVMDGARGHATAGRRNCETRRDYYAGNDPYRDPYVRDDGYRNDGYRDDGYRNDGYSQDPYRDQRRDENGRMVATVIGGIAGAVLGSRIGDGSGQYIGTAVGSMVGGMAGRGIYDANRRQREVRDGYVTTCDPEPYYGNQDAGYPGEHAVSAYDVTYEYAGRQYVTRTDHHPGDRIRVRVDVRAE